MEEDDLSNENMSKQLNVRQRNVSIDTFAFGPFILPTLFLAKFHSADASYALNSRC